MSIEQIEPEHPAQQDAAAEPTPQPDVAEAEGDITPAEPAPALPRVRLAEGASPTAEQIRATRAEHWHQDGKALLSLGEVREWLNRAGLVLFAPRPQQLPMPAPSFVEATLGRAAAAADFAEMGTAKNLLTRLIADGSAVPLNLLGPTGGLGSDTPDFVVSAAVFSYIFTLRGNKAWKQPPVTSGPVKVSPLALAAYEALSAKVMLTVADLTHELGSGVTESGVLRALTELWGQMRVIPVPQQDGSTTLWELATARFTKQIKAGSNAGQPSALSALCSLYLAQALLATEDEIETFLSPLAPRSRVREVIHALTAARQLETIVIGGKSLLHVSGDAPAFTAAAEVPSVAGGAEGGSRISTFSAKPASKIASGLRTKPAFGKKSYGAGRGDSSSSGRERRPFQRGAAAGPAFDSGRGDTAGRPRPQFNKPWDEDRGTRIAAGAANDQSGGEQLTPNQPVSEPRFRPQGDRLSFPSRKFTPAGEQRSFSSKSRFEGSRGQNSQDGQSRAPRRDASSRTGFSSRSEGDAPRKTYSKPGTFGRKREGSAGNEERAPRRDFGGAGRTSAGGERRPGSYAPRPQGSSSGNAGGFNSPRPDYARENSAAGSGDAPRKVFRKFDAPRDRKPGGGGGGKSLGAKPFGGGGVSRKEGERKSFTPGSSARPPRSFDGPRTPRPPFGGTDRSLSNRNDRSSFGGTDRPRSDRQGGERAGAERSAPGSRQGGFSAPKKPFNKAGGFASKGGPFAKFADGAKPFRKPGEKRPPRPGGGNGGFAPSKRKREEE